MLGEEFEGVLGCDYFSAYRKYMGEMSGIVGAEELALVDASGVVYAVNKNNLIEVHVMDDDTYQALIDAGAECHSALRGRYSKSTTSLSLPRCTVSPACRP